MGQAASPCEEKGGCHSVATSVAVHMGKEPGTIAARVPHDAFVGLLHSPRQADGKAKGLPAEAFIAPARRQCCSCKVGVCCWESELVDDSCEAWEFAQRMKSTVPSGFYFTEDCDCSTECCCAQEDGPVEEVFIIHHKSIRKVLLSMDELQHMECMAMPECVMAVRREKIRRQLLRWNPDPAASGLGSTFLSSGLEPLHDIDAGSQAATAATWTIEAEPPRRMVGLAAMTTTVPL